MNSILICWWNNFNDVVMALSIASLLLWIVSAAVAIVSRKNTGFLTRALSALTLFIASVWFFADLFNIFVRSLPIMAVAMTISMAGLCLLLVIAWMYGISFRRRERKNGRQAR